MASGRRPQEGFPCTREIPRVVKFDRLPQLDASLKSSPRHSPFVTRSRQQLISWRRSSERKQPTLTRIMSGLMAFNYQKRLDDLAAPSWLVDTFRHHLNADFWPPSDKLEGSPLVQDLVRSGRGSRASWRCGFQARSLRGVPTAAARVVGHLFAPMYHVSFLRSQTEPRFIYPSHFPHKYTISGPSS
jgi:hypothetical protein